MQRRKLRIDGETFVFYQGSPPAHRHVKQYFQQETPEFISPDLFFAHNDINIKKLHSLQNLVRTTRRTKTANITKDVTSASHRQNVIVLQK